MPTFSLSNPGTQIGYDADSVNLSLTAQVSSLHTLSYSETNLPPGLAVSNGGMNGSTGHAIISGTIASNADQPGPYTVTITATDTTTNATVSQTFSWNVRPTTVTLTQPSNQIDCDGDTASLHLSASDNAHHALTYTESGLPTGLSINSSSGVISGTVGANDQLTTYSVTVTATDGGAGVTASKTFTWTLVTIAAVLTNPGDQYGYDHQAVSVTVVAHTSYANAGIFVFSEANLPGSLSLGSTTGVISGTIASNADASSPYSVTVSVTDSSANQSASQAFDWAVSAEAVSLANPGNQTNSDGDTVNLGVSASDYANNQLVWNESGLPAGLSIDSNGNITGTIASNADQSGPYTATVTATDQSAGVTASQTFSWNLSPVTVTMTSPGDQTNNDGDTVALHLATTDSAGHELAYSVAPSAPLPPGLTLDPASGLISGQIDVSADEDSPYSVRLIASDSAANVNESQTITWTVAANPSAPINVGPTGENRNVQPNIPNPGIVAVNAPAGTYTGLTAFSTGPDGESVRYSFSNAAESRFQINQYTGVITVATCPAAGNCNFIVVATATQSGTTAQTQFTVNVVAANQLPNPPGAPTAAANSPGYGLVAAFAQSGTSTELTVTSAGASSYWLTNSADGLFTINNQGLVTVADGTRLSFEPAPSYSITVQAWSAGGASAPAPFTIYPKLYGVLGEPWGDSVAQGSFADCWFVAALVELADDDPASLAEMIEPVPNKPLQFDVWINGTNGWNQEPVNFDNVNDWSNYSKSNGFWVKVFEQGYQNAGGLLLQNNVGAAIPVLTDDQATGFNFWDLENNAWTESPSTVFDLISAARDECYIVTANTPGGAADTLISNHAYSVMWTFYDNGDPSDPCVELRNPWGENDPSYGNNGGYFYMPLITFMDDFQGIDFEVPAGNPASTDTAETDSSPQGNAPGHPLAVGAANTAAPALNFADATFLNSPGADLNVFNSSSQGLTSAGARALGNRLV